MNYLILPEPMLIDYDFHCRLYDKIAINNLPGACHLWIASTRPDAYGTERPVIKYKMINYYAVRVLYFITYKVDPRSLLVMHTCDNPMCMTPKHLRLGDHQDNANDKVDKGRQYMGERHDRAILTEDNVISIRLLVSEGVSQAECARIYGVHPNTINEIIRGKNWKQV